MTAEVVNVEKYNVLISKLNIKIVLQILHQTKKGRRNGCFGGVP